MLQCKGVPSWHLSGHHLAVQTNRMRSALAAEKNGREAGTGKAIEEETIGTNEETIGTKEEGTIGISVHKAIGHRVAHENEEQEAEEKAKAHKPAGLSNSPRGASRVDCGCRRRWVRMVGLSIRTLEIACTQNVIRLGFFLRRQAWQTMR